VQILVQRLEHPGRAVADGGAEIEPVPAALAAGDPCDIEPLARSDEMGEGGLGHGISSLRGLPIV
jgi:hypothetical protein